MEHRRAVLEAAGGAEVTPLRDTPAVDRGQPRGELTGIGGVRIEDTVLVTEDGCERLTLAPKDPMVV